MKIRSVCSNCGKKSLFIKHDFGLYAIAQCRGCHSIFRDRILSRKEDELLYDKDYYLNLQKEYFLNCLTPNPRDKSRLADFNRRLDLLEKFISHNSKIRLLDVGSGTGAFAYLAEKRGWDTVSLEISNFASDIARKKFKVKTYCGEVTDEKFKEKNFDVITLWEAIANIEDTERLLKKVRSILRKNGRIAILTTVVDSWLYYIANLINFLSFGKINYFVKEGYPIHHSNHFSRKVLQKILSKEGFKVIYLENLEIPYKYTKLPKIFLPLLIIFGNIARLAGITIQVLIVVERK